MNLTIKTLAAAALVSGGLAAPGLAADTYTIDSGHTLVAFELNHLGFSNTLGWVADVSGTIRYDANDVANSAVDVTMQTGSITTNHDHRDDWIHGEKVMNVAAQPVMTFISTGIEKTSDSTGRITGDLTMNGVTKSVVLDAVLNNFAPHPMSGTDTLGISASTTFKRSDWGVTEFVGPLGDELKVRIELEATRTE